MKTLASQGGIMVKEPGYEYGKKKKQTNQKPAVYAELQQETGTTFPELSKWTPGLLLVCGMI